jgi:hypothetical protein
MRVLLAISALLLFAPSADAHVSWLWQKEALAVAQRVWHPSCGALHISFGDPISAGFSPDAPVVGWTYLNSCENHINQDFLWLGYPQFCTVELHEAGHSAGRPDTDGPGIMNRYLTPSRGDWYYKRHHRWHRKVIWYDTDRRCIRPADR